MQRVDNKHFRINNNLQPSSYTQTMNRFNNILHNKLYVSNGSSLLVDPNKKAKVNPLLQDKKDKVNPLVPKGKEQNPLVPSANNSINNQFTPLQTKSASDLRFNTKILSVFKANEATGNLEMPKPHSVVQSTEVLADSGDSVAIIDRHLAGTPMAGMGSVFKDAEMRTGVNAYVLAAIAMHESAYGSSQIAQGKNNLFGFQAYDDSPYESAKSYASFNDSVYDVASYLRREYLSPNGQHFKGYSLESIGMSYASDPAWARKVKNFVNRFRR